MNLSEKDNKDVEILNFINSYYKENYLAPSLPEIEAEIEMPRKTLQRHLLKLHTLKELKYDAKLKTVVTPEMEGKEVDDVVTLNILGRIACGLPQDEKQCSLGEIDFPKALLGIGDYFILEANGGSMVNAGINSGDYVVVKRTCMADPDDIVVAMNGNNETTLKTLKFDKDKMCYYLHPEAAGYKDIYPEEIDVIGVATKIIKNIKRAS